MWLYIDNATLGGGSFRTVARIFQRLCPTDPVDLQHLAFAKFSITNLLEAGVVAN